MKLIYLEFDTRYYYTDEEQNQKYKDLTVRLTFDKLDSINLDENLQVCTSETIRGKNKTFNAYLKPKTFSITGQFSDRQSTNVEILEQQTDEISGEIKDLLSINTLTGRDKSKRINDLFETLVEDTRLVNLRLFYGDYENFVINNFTLNYTDASTINVELGLQEILLRDLQQFEDFINIPYQVVEDLTEEQLAKIEYILSRLPEVSELLGSYNRIIRKSEIDSYLDTYSQGGHYGE